MSFVSSWLPTRRTSGAEVEAQGTIHGHDGGQPSVRPDPAASSTGQGIPVMPDQASSPAIDPLPLQDLERDDAGPAMGIPLAGAILGFSTGFYQAAKRAGLVFMAENAHRRPDTVQGWYFYNKTKVGTQWRVLQNARVARADDWLSYILELPRGAGCGKGRDAFGRAHGSVDICLCCSRSRHLALAARARARHGNFKRASSSIRGHGARSRCSQDKGTKDTRPGDGLGRSLGGWRRRRARCSCWGFFYLCVARLQAHAKCCVPLLTDFSHSPPCRSLAGASGTSRPRVWDSDGHDSRCSARCSDCCCKETSRASKQRARSRTEQKYRKADVVVCCREYVFWTICTVVFCAIVKYIFKFRVYPIFKSFCKRVKRDLARWIMGQAHEGAADCSIPPRTQVPSPCTPLDEQEGAACSPNML
jgi:hypothetical protein